MYRVTGGIFTDTTFTRIESQPEDYGPFETYEEALAVWKKATFNEKLDICTHRLKIEGDSNVG